jgi:XTP/dITP diphosphohydrolase
VAQERTDGTGYTIDDVADGIIGKLTRRHPHVFADVEVSGPDDVKRNWDEIKAAERAAAGGGEPVSALDGVPLHQPALSLAAQLLRRAERAGAPQELAGASDELAGAPAQVADTRGVARPGAEPADASPTGAGTAADAAGGAAGELGQELFALVQRARAAGLDPELELRTAALGYADRVRAWERDR